MPEAGVPRHAQPRRVALPAAGFALAWFVMLTVGTGSLDGHILRFLYAGDNPAVAAIARGLTMLGEGPVVILVSVAGAAWLLWLEQPKRGFALLAVTLVGRLLVDLQKYSIMRLRPQDEAHLVPVSTPSFPSGHAANSMILWLTLALVLFSHTRWRNLAVGLALCLSLAIGISRVVLGVHWPTDVIGGWSFGILWVLLALPLAERLAR